MTTTIANPIYDLAFKYLMEDDRVVKILLSAPGPRTTTASLCRKDCLPPSWKA